MLRYWRLESWKQQFCYWFFITCLFHTKKNYCSYVLHEICHSYIWMYILNLLFEFSSLFFHEKNSNFMHIKLFLFVDITYSCKSPGLFKSRDNMTDFFFLIGPDRKWMFYFLIFCFNGRLNLETLFKISSTYNFQTMFKINCSKTALNKNWKTFFKHFIF